MITVNCNLNIKTCCFGASSLYDAKLSYLRAHRDSGSWWFLGTFPYT